MTPEQHQLAMRGFERIKGSDLTMDGFTMFHGRLSMDEKVAMNEEFAAVGRLLDPIPDEVYATDAEFPGDVCPEALASVEAYRAWLIGGESQ